jgi:hypothetical protein
MALQLSSRCSKRPILLRINAYFLAASLLFSHILGDKIVMCWADAVNKKGCVAPSMTCPASQAMDADRASPETNNNEVFKLKETQYPILVVLSRRQQGEVLPTAMRNFLRPRTASLSGL